MVNPATPHDCLLRPRVWCHVLVLWVVLGAVAAGQIGCGDDASPVDAATGDAGPQADGAVTGDADTDGATSNPNERFLPAFAPGTRLEVRAVGQGSPALFRTFYDTQLEVECAFAPAADGTLRCMPPWEFSRIGVRYADSTCTDARYYTVREECGDRSYHVIAREDERRCDFGRVLDVVRLNELPNAPTQAYAFDPSDTCVDSGAFPATTAFAGEAVAPTEFVSGRIVPLEGQTAPGVRVLEADDGARLVLQAYDARYELGCSPFDFEGSASPRCLTTPSPRIDPWWYSDTACGEPLAWTDKRPSSCVTPAFGTRAGELTRIGAERTSAIYQEARGMCVEATPTDYAFWTIYDVAGPGSLDDLYPLSFATFGAEPIAPYFVTSDDGTLLLPESLWDGGRNHPCEPRVLSDDTLACVPTRVALRETFFVDSGCTDPVIIYTDGIPDAALEEEFSPCPLPFGGLRVTGVWEVGAMVTGPVYQQRGGMCEEFTLTGTQQAFRIGPEISRMLPVLTEQTVASP